PVTQPMLRAIPASLALLAAPLLAEPAQLSGIYPHLAYYNDEGECGTGAVVPWADRLWIITYAPHKPLGSSDKLYEITPDLELIIRPESIGGTPANRMIHEESQQLFIGPHAIDATGKVRTIPLKTMPGRPTGNARHLTDPAGKIYFATMEEGIYEVDVETLAVTELFADDQGQIGHYQGTAGQRRLAKLPGYHGKGLYSGHGRLIYANNGEAGGEAKVNPATPSGVLASWDGKSDNFEVIRRNQFTEVTGPGGIHGNKNPDSDPIWAMGWDHRSLILMLLDGGEWHSFRLPKATHTYDGAHGWNTEWPRIREIGQGDDFLATMHGTFWKFPKSFSLKNTAGIEPRSTYLKVIGDFARWNDRIVFGCDDTAQSEFLNKRKAKGHITPPQSHSNLWFVDPSQLASFGPPIGRGAVWAGDDVKAHTPSEPYLFSGYDKRGVHLTHGSSSTLTFHFEIDEKGTGTWTDLAKVEVPAKGHVWHSFPASNQGPWIRVSIDKDATDVTAAFQYRDADPRPTTADAIFDGLATAAESPATGGILRPRADNARTLALAATDAEGKPAGAYELHADLTLKPATDAGLDSHTRKNAAIPAGILKIEDSSVLFIDDKGKRWRLPKGDPALDQACAQGDSRVAREVATERDFFHAHGTFYELPAENAGGFAKVRPVTTHNRRVHDFCSYRGLFIMTGISADAPSDNAHIIRSADGKASLWAGAIDDAWKMGKPRGHGGPWKNSEVKAGTASDPFLMTGYDEKTLTLSSSTAATITAEIDLTGEGRWAVYQKFELSPGTDLTHAFPADFGAYWIRFTSDKDTRASAQLEYR
ncbi:MAG: hypothetical protein RLZ97_47, partial [Verrucomicrobiota bacterium]